MNRLVQKIGFWASLIAAISFVIFTICFVAIAATQDLIMWTNLDDYFKSILNNNQIYKYVAQTCVLVFGLSYLAILNCIGEIADPKKKILSKISISFGIIFITLIGINYFIQITAVQFNIQAGITDGLSNWIMLNPNSISLSIAMLGWTIMFGLSSLFAASIFEGKGISRTIRVLFVVNGIFCLLGGFGFLIQNITLVNLTMNMGMGGVMTILTIVLSRYFWKKRITTPPQSI
ncbi:hypothetical protein ACFL6I_12140 [candidate division KSB1 bacterium]